MAKSDGGPAFPVPGEHVYEHPAHGLVRPSDLGHEGPTGMSLRDYFAGQALAGMLAADAVRGDYDYEVTARSAFALADAMLAARTAPAHGGE